MPAIDLTGNLAVLLTWPIRCDINIPTNLLVTSTNYEFAHPLCLVFLIVVVFEGEFKNEIVRKASPLRISFVIFKWRNYAGRLRPYFPSDRNFLTVMFSGCLRISVQ